MESSFARQLIEENHTFHLENLRILPKENYGQRLNKLEALEIYLSSENEEKWKP